MALTDRQRAMCARLGISEQVLEIVFAEEQAEAAAKAPRPKAPAPKGK